MAPVYAQQFPSYQAYGEHHGRHLPVLGDPGERVDASELALVHRSELLLQLTLIMRLISVYGGLEEAVSRYVSKSVMIDCGT